MSEPYEVLPHTADIKMRAFGASLPELFAHAMSGMFALLSPRKKTPITRVHHPVSVRSTKTEFLLVEFLSECLYLSDAYNEAYDTTIIETFNETHIQAIIYGYSISGFSGQEIKAVTYHDISIKQVNGLWQATIVFDI